MSFKIESIDVLNARTNIYLKKKIDEDFIDNIQGYNKTKFDIYHLSIDFEKLVKTITTFF
jgi:hypothetical protein